MAVRVPKQQWGIVAWGAIPFLGYGCEKKVTTETNKATHRQKKFAASSMKTLLQDLRSSLIGYG